MVTIYKCITGLNFCLKTTDKTNGLSLEYVDKTTQFFYSVMALLFISFRKG